MMTTVRVPATSANLGPGFDCFGVALSLYGYFSFEEIPGGLRFQNVESAYQNENNLAIRSYRRVLEEIHQPQPGLFLKIDSQIPISRGLGSSASLIVAGAYAANAAHGFPLDSRSILNIAAQLEGHPDNVAPALLGGLTACMMGKNGVIAKKCGISDRVRFCALIPDFELSTKKAREALPRQIGFQSACLNVSHAAVLLKCMECGDFEGISFAMEDQLHQPFRAPLIDEYHLVRDLCLQNGAAAFCISGAGPTLMGIYESEAFPDRMREALRTARHVWQVLPLTTDQEGAKKL